MSPVNKKKRHQVWFTNKKVHLDIYRSKVGKLGKNLFFIPVTFDP
jgi:hypothetical protein